MFEPTDIAVDDLSNTHHVPHAPYAFILFYYLGVPNQRMTEPNVRQTMKITSVSTFFH